jgi:hypothetical protein
MKLILIENISPTMFKLYRYLGKKLDSIAEMDYSDPEVNTQSMKTLIEDFRVNGAELEPISA